MQIGIRTYAAVWTIAVIIGATPANAQNTNFDGAYAGPASVSQGGGTERLGPELVTGSPES